MTDQVPCPICYDQGCSSLITDRDSSGFDCRICGNFEIAGSTLASYFSPDSDRLTKTHRALLSHRLHAISPTSKPFLIVTDWLKTLISEGTLPNRMVQAANLVRFIGDEVTRTGEPLPNFPVNIHALISAIDRLNMVSLVNELQHRGILKFLDTDRLHHKIIDLTLDGWKEYEAELRGQFSGDYGFMAMQFGEATLEDFVKTVVKPAVWDGIGYKLVDMRDVARAGIIDNIMRMQIRDSAFIIVDLTHDNSGAYWEAGYAEGLGKPVIYICEKSKFKQASTHFDTNHCTTVRWSDRDPDSFRVELVATLRRSLDIL